MSFTAQIGDLFIVIWESSTYESRATKTGLTEKQRWDSTYPSPVVIYEANSTSVQLGLGGNSFGYFRVTF